MNEAIPIACALSDQDLQKRRRDILDKTAAALINSEELPNGFRYQFPLEDDLLENLAAIINLERKCCPFLDFNLSLKSGEPFISFDLTGEKGAKEAIRELFGWN